MHTLYDSTLTRWQNYTVNEVVRQHWSSTDRSGNASLQQKGCTLALSFEFDISDMLLRNLAQGAHIPRPSPVMMDALLSLSVSIQQLGTPTISPRRKQCVEHSLRGFGRAVVISLRKSAKRSKDTLIQDVWDLTFLQLIIKLWDSDDSNSDSPADTYIKELRDQVSNKCSNNHSASPKSSTVDIRRGFFFTARRRHQDVRIPIQDSSVDCYITASDHHPIFVPICQRQERETLASSPVRYLIDGFAELPRPQSCEAITTFRYVVSRDQCHALNISLLDLPVQLSWESILRLRAKLSIGSSNCVTFFLSRSDGETKQCAPNFDNFGFFGTLMFDDSEHLSLPPWTSVLTLVSPVCIAHVNAGSNVTLSIARSSRRLHR